MGGNWKASSEVEWDEHSIQEFCNYLYEIVDLKTCREIEKEVRIETGTCDRLQVCNNHSHHDTHGHNVKEKCTDAKGLNLSTYKFKKDEDDIVGEILDNEKEEDVIKKNIPYITKKAFSVYSNVVRKAQQEENEYMDTDTDNFLRMHIFRILLTKIIVSSVRKRVKELHCKSTRDITGLANPLHIKDNSLESITNETMSDLMKKGVAVQKKFIGKSMSELIYKELQFIEFNNQFNEFNKEYVKIRTDFYCWTYINNLDRERQKGLYKLLKALALLPFELNKKANLSLQMCSLFQFSYFAPDKSFLKKHCQGGYNILDTGKKVTLIYIPYVHPGEQVTLKVYKMSHHNCSYMKQSKKEEKKVNGDTKEKENEKQKENENGNENKNETENGKEKGTEKVTEKEDPGDIEEKESLLLEFKPQSDSLIFLQTRNTTYEISKTTQKFFVINFWISGPVSPDKTM